MTMHASDGFDEDDLGFLIARCTCGWTQGGLPGMEEVVDFLMQHASEQAHLEAKNEAG